MTTQQIIQVDPEMIQCPKQVRTAFDENAMEELKTSIQAVGILHPILVRKENDNLIVWDGERRIRAALALKLATVPVIISDTILNKPEIIQRQLITSHIHQSLNYLDKAKAIKQLIELTGFSASGVATLTGISQPTISKLMSILDLPADQQARVASGDLGLKAAYEQATRVQLEKRDKPTRMQKITFRIDKERVVVITGIESTMSAFHRLWMDIFKKFQQAQKQGIELPTFTAMLMDQTMNQ